MLKYSIIIKVDTDGKNDNDLSNFNNKSISQYLFEV